MRLISAGTQVSLSSLNPPNPSSVFDESSQLDRIPTSDTIQSTCCFFAIRALETSKAAHCHLALIPAITTAPRNSSTISIPNLLLQYTMASFRGTKADYFRYPFATIPTSFDGSSGNLKRKRAGDDFGLPTTPESAIEHRKRLKYNEAPCIQSAQYSGSEKILEIRVPYSRIHSASLANPIEETQAPNVSGGYSVLPSDRKPNGYGQKSQVDLRHMWHEPPAHYTSDEGSDSAIRMTTQKLKTDSMTIVERKHFFIYTPTEGMKATAKKHFSDIYQLLDTSGSNDDCRLHPTPPQFNGRAAGTISFGLNWRDEYGSHKLAVNWGIIALVVRQQLTDAQMDGFINRSWQLSHLCGNWTCCNWRHFTVESGTINRSRNGCFNSPARCTHIPPCMKEKKRQLLATNYIRSKISNAITSLGGILSYEAFHALADYEVGVVEWFWENSKRGSCAFCGRSDDKAHICSCLSSLVECKVMLRALKQCIKPTLEVREAIGYLVKIKEDLKRGSAVKGKNLTGWLVRRGRSEDSPDVQPITNDTCRQTHRCKELEQTYVRLKNTGEELRKKRTELYSKCRQQEGTAEDVDLLAEAESSHRKTTWAMTNVAREWEKSRRKQAET